MIMAKQWDISQFEDHFDADEFVEKASRTTNILYKYNADLGEDDDDDFDPTPLLETFERTIDDLWILHEQSVKNVTQLEESCRRREKDHGQTMAQLEELMTEAFDSLRDLGSNINQVATKIVHVGDQLETVNAKRGRSVDAVTVMEHFEAFQRTEEELLAPFNEEDFDLLQAADLIQKLQFIAAELPNNRFTAGRLRIEEKFNEIEDSLGAEFGIAFGDVEDMHDYAHALYPFKLYNLAVDRFITTFITSEFETSTTVDTWKATLMCCHKAYKVTEAVFRNPQVVMISFIQEIICKRVKKHVDKTLSATVDGRVQYLEHLFHMHKKTRELLRQITSSFDLGLDVHFEEKLRRTVFGQYLEAYITLEEEVLQESYEKLIGDYDETTEKPLMGNKSPSRNKEVKAHDPDETYLSHDVTLSMIDENKAALKRCEELATQSELAPWTYKIFIKLVDALCMDHMKSALNFAITHLPPKKPKQEPETSFFLVARDANSIIYLVQKLFWDCILPSIRSSVTIYPECVAAKNQMLDVIESQLADGLDLTLESIVEWLRNILQKEQKKTDFKPPEDQMLEVMNGPSTNACRSCCIFLRKQTTRISNCINGKNLEVMLHELGTRFHAVLLDHIKQLTINTLGGMLLTRDLTEYEACIQRFNDPLLGEMFLHLRELSALTIVRPENIANLIDEGRLAKVEKQLIQTFLQLRSDYKSAKINALVR